MSDISAATKVKQEILSPNRDIRTVFSSHNALTRALSEIGGGMVSTCNIASQARNGALDCDHALHSSFAAFAGAFYERMNDFAALQNANARCGKLIESKGYLTLPAAEPGEILPTQYLALQFVRLMDGFTEPDHPLNIFVNDLRRGQKASEKTLKIVRDFRKAVRGMNLHWKALHLKEAMPETVKYFGALEQYFSTLETRLKNLPKAEPRPSTPPHLRVIPTTAPAVQTPSVP